MTVSSSKFQQFYTGNGSTKAFNFTIQAFDKSWIKGYVDGDLKSSSVVMNGSNTGGTITFSSAPPSGSEVLVERRVPINQATDFPEYSPFPARNTEDAFDKIVMALAQYINIEGGVVELPTDLVIKYGDSIKFANDVNQSGAQADASYRIISEDNQQFKLQRAFGGQYVDVLAYNGTKIELPQGAVTPNITGSSSSDSVINKAYSDAQDAILAAVDAAQKLDYQSQIDAIEKEINKIIAGTAKSIVPNKEWLIFCGEGVDGDVLDIDSVGSFRQRVDENFGQQVRLPSGWVTTEYISNLGAKIIEVVQVMYNRLVMRKGEPIRFRDSTTDSEEAVGAYELVNDANSFAIRRYQSDIDGESKYHSVYRHQNDGPTYIYDNNGDLTAKFDIATNGEGTDVSELLGTDESVVTRKKGDARYGAKQDVEDAALAASNAETAASDAETAAKAAEDAVADKANKNGDSANTFAVKESTSNTNAATVGQVSAKAKIEVRSDEATAVSASSGDTKNLYVWYE